MRKLYILRHAKSAWDTDAVSDFQRPLAKRGMRNARLMGEWMVEHAINPEYIISSPALRTWQTVTLVCNALGIDETRIECSIDLYLAEVETLLTRLRQVPASINSVLLVGHNPGLEELVMWITNGRAPRFGDGKLLPTATLAIFSMDVGWEQLDVGKATLVQINRAR
jgi:phosphohistidine phosphatase